MRPRLAALCVVALLAASAASHGAETDPPLFVFVGNADPRSDAIREELAAIALREGTALVDETPAPPAPPQANVELSRAIAAYQRFDHKEALTHIQAALEEATSTGAAGLTPSELSDLFIYRALAEASLGDSTSSWDDFVRAAVLDPARRIDPVRFPPSVVESFGRAVEVVSESEPVELVVVAPPACEVAVDARTLGQGRSAHVLAGEHYVRVVCPGKLPHGARVSVVAGPVTHRPKLAAPERPDDRAIARMAARRGLGRVLLVRLVASEKPTASIRLLDEQGEEIAATSAAVDGQSTAGASVAAGVDRVLERARPVVLEVPTTETERAFYQRPWFWGLVGAAATAAILVPFAVDSSPPSGFDITPEGDLP